MVAEERFERVEVDSQEALHVWLLRHHVQDDGIWLVTSKKVVPERYVSREQVLDQLVAFGWTDGVRRQLDERRTMQLVSPRRTAVWAKSYRDRAERLLAEGRMHPAGLAAVERAKAAGTWDSMPDVDALVVPDDLAEALGAAPPAATTFAAFPPSVRRNVLRWIASAKTPPTRAKRIAATASEAQRGVRVKSNG